MVRPIWLCQSRHFASERWEVIVPWNPKRTTISNGTHRHSVSYSFLHHQGRCEFIEWIVRVNSQFGRWRRCLFRRHRGEGTCQHKALLMNRHSIFVTVFSDDVVFNDSSLRKCDCPWKGQSAIYFNGKQADDLYPMICNLFAAGGSQTFSWDWT